ncbi:MAG: BON domain-containing protein, partial [Lacipirellulaceae bacterium]
EALRKNAHHGLTCVTCEIRDGMVILHGKVPRYYVKQMAQEIAKNSEGVDSVVNRIQVETEPLDPTHSR